MIAIEYAANPIVTSAKSSSLIERSFFSVLTEIASCVVELWMRTANSNVIQSWTTPTQSFAAC